MHIAPGLSVIALTYTASDRRCGRGEVVDRREYLHWEICYGSLLRRKGSEALELLASFNEAQCSDSEFSSDGFPSGGFVISVLYVVMACSNFQHIHPSNICIEQAGSVNTRERISYPKFQRLYHISYLDSEHRR
jgi:hypothetical protein